MTIIHSSQLVGPMSTQRLPAPALLRAGLATGPKQADVLPPGTVVLGRYEVIRTVGQGGMGFVVAARHKQLGRLDAIKFLLPHVATNRQILERFKREARATAALDSPHIARVYDADVTETGEAFIVMEFVDGPDLKSILRNGPLSIPETVEYLLQVCVGLNVAHRQGIVHRDLKPSNLLLSIPTDEPPRIKIVDFGIAKVMAPDESNDLTVDGPAGFLGTIPYMSPEQLRGAQNVDARSDIWALGVIAYEFLTARKPFEGSSKMELVSTIIDKDTFPGAPTLYRPDLPLPLERIIWRCLAKNRDERYASVLELAAALREAKEQPPPIRSPMLSQVSEATQGNTAVTNAPLSTARSSSRIRPMAMGAGVVITMVSMMALRTVVPGTHSRGRSLASARGPTVLMSQCEDLRMGLRKNAELKELSKSLAPLPSTPSTPPTVTKETKSKPLGQTGLATNSPNQQKPQVPESPPKEDSPKSQPEEKPPEKSMSPFE